MDTGQKCEEIASSPFFNALMAAEDTNSECRKWVHLADIDFSSILQSVQIPSPLDRIAAVWSNFLQGPCEMCQHFRVKAVEN